jgi:3-deoxy-manno-octulosonate cytidylyltransferase (CMP-KDO synthetase)
MDTQTKKPTIIGVIPARYASTRLEGKVLADIGGKPMVQHVYEAALKSKLLEKVIVAVDDERVLNAVQEFGGEAVMTDPECPSGTDRVAAAVQDLDVDIVVNIQADEPFTNANFIDEAVQPLIDNEELQFSTVCHSIDDPDKYPDPGTVKVVRDLQGNGLYFSRALIPYPRYPEDYIAYEHLGIYAYRKDALLRFIQWPPSPLERTESLEMLRILDNDEKIYVAQSNEKYYALSVDTQEDLEEARQLYEQLQQGAE